MRRSTAWMLGSILLVFVMVLGVSCAKKTVTTEGEPKAAPAPMPAPAPEAKPAPPAPAAEDKFAVAKKAVEADDIYFDFDKYNLKSEAIKVLDKKVALMRENSQMKVRIEGNCDERGSNEYNLALGDRRANAAKSYMAKAGIAENRLSSISYGEERPVCKEHNETCWAKNRHDHFVVQ
ncbi:MAG TPA: peptidoglycan-associated lipoprotein Pal [Syntrophobacteria bacterium]|nr:peptidoglycan-associated lipoprotein Pal [Syntrophobacteria bacterium]